MLMTRIRREATIPFLKGFSLLEPFKNELILTLMSFKPMFSKHNHPHFPTQAPSTLKIIDSLLRNVHDKVLGIKKDLQFLLLVHHKAYMT